MVEIFGDCGGKWFDHSPVHDFRDEPEGPAT